MKEPISFSQIKALKILCVLPESHPELAHDITTLTAVMEIANFCAAMDTMIDQGAWERATNIFYPQVQHFRLWGSGVLWVVYSEK